MSDTLATTWGYTIGAAALADILTVADFNVITGGKFTGDTRIESSIKAAQLAIRNYCGWHIAPNLPCMYGSMILRGNGRIKNVGRDMLIQLPATVLSEIDYVGINEVECQAGFGDVSGVIHVFDVAPVHPHAYVEVEYQAGLSEADAALIKGLIADMVVHALSSSYGITSEAAGGESVTYNSSWASMSNAGILSETTKDALEPYKLKGVF